MTAIVDTPVNPAERGDRVHLTHFCPSALRRNEGNLARTCEELQLAKTTLHDKMRKHNLSGDIAR